MEQTTGLFHSLREAQEGIEESAKDGWMVKSMAGDGTLLLVVYQREKRGCE